MEDIAQDAIIRNTLISSIDREELLLKKYDEYNSFINDKEIKEMMNEFKIISRQHIDLLKGKLQKLDI